jgi:hypothetical protein
MPDHADNQSLTQRVERIEAQLAIGQLPIRYAIAIDSRDLDAWVQLFVDDVDCGRHGRGREALKRFIDPNVRTFYRSHHQICGHQVEHICRERAINKEVGDRWYVMAICYFDRYERRDGQWYFARRSEKHWYTSDVQQQPSTDSFCQWSVWQSRPPELPRAFPSWATFWQASEPNAIRRLTTLP